MEICDVLVSKYLFSEDLQGNFAPDSATSITYYAWSTKLKNKIEEFQINFLFKNHRTLTFPHKIQ